MSLARRTVLFSALAIAGVSIAEVAAPTSAVAATRTVAATGSVYVRQGAGTKYRALGVLRKGQRVPATGKRQGKWVQVRFAGKTGWVSNKYLTTASTSIKKTTVRKPVKVTSSVEAPAGAIAVATTLPLASRVSMPSGVGSNGKRIASEVKLRFPWITTILGYRAGYGSDHNTGRAVDIMIPSYRSNGALGQAIADHLRANASRFGITYVIWNQQIWSVQRSSEGWRRMSNRGSDNANHKNHVHVSFR